MSLEGVSTVQYVQNCTCNSKEINPNTAVNAYKDEECDTALTVVINEDLCVDGGGVHQKIPGLRGEHPTHHSGHCNSVEPSSRSLHINTQSSEGPPA